MLHEYRFRLMIKEINVDAILNFQNNYQWKKITQTLNISVYHLLYTNSNNSCWEERSQVLKEDQSIENFYTHFARIWSWFRYSVSFYATYFCSLVRTHLLELQLKLHTKILGNYSNSNYICLCNRSIRL